MKKILFGVSDTNECRRAVECLARLFGADIEVTLLFVAQDGFLMNAVSDYASLNIAQNIEGDELLGEFEREFLRFDISVKKVIKQGNAAEILLDFAKDYDLLVIGESESSLLHRLFNSHQDLFISASPIPVLIAK